MPGEDSQVVRLVSDYGIVGMASGSGERCWLGEKEAAGGVTTGSDTDSGSKVRPGGRALVVLLVAADVEPTVWQYSIACRLAEDSAWRRASWIESAGSTGGGAEGVGSGAGA